MSFEAKMENMLTSRAETYAGIGSRGKDVFVRVCVFDRLQIQNPVRIREERRTEQQETKQESKKNRAQYIPTSYES